MPFLKMSQIKSKQKDIQKIAIYVIYIFIYQLINNYKCITLLNIWNRAWYNLILIRINRKAMILLLKAYLKIFRETWNYM